MPDNQTTSPRVLRKLPLSTAITFKQFYQLLFYLEKDRTAHIRAHGNWRLDGGKLVSALESAGIGTIGTTRFK